MDIDSSDEVEEVRESLLSCIGQIWMPEFLVKSTVVSRGIYRQNPLCAREENRQKVLPQSLQNVTQKLHGLVLRIHWSLLKLPRQDGRAVNAQRRWKKASEICIVGREPSPWCFINKINSSCCRVLSYVPMVLQIPNQLHFFTKIGDFLHARCKKSLLNVKNLPVDSRRN